MIMKFRQVCIVAVWLVLTTSLRPCAFAQNSADLAKKLDILNAYPDAIVVNADIHTMDANLTRVQAMAVRNERILLLGTNDQVRFLAGPKTQIIDTKGRVVIPALVDSHTHPNLWGVQH